MEFTHVLHSLDYLYKCIDFNTAEYEKAARSYEDLSGTAAPIKNIGRPSVGLTTNKSGKVVSDPKFWKKLGEDIDKKLLVEDSQGLKDVAACAYRNDGDIARDCYARLDRFAFGLL